MAATGYLLTAFLIWALVVALGMTRDDTTTALTPRTQRDRRKRFGMRPALRRMRPSTPPDLLPVSFHVARAPSDELRSTL